MIRLGGEVMSKKAPESENVKRSRRKLRRLLEEQDELMTEKAIEKIKEGINRWISRHGNERVKLKDKSIKLFDENKHPAKEKRPYVKHLMQELRHEIEEGRTLKGRVAKGSP